MAERPSTRRVSSTSEVSQGDAREFPLEDAPPLNGKRLKLAVAVFFMLAGLGCNTGGISENDYTCNGFCNGEPLPALIIQAPDPGTACTEFLETCRGAGTCTSCS